MDAGGAGPSNMLGTFVADEIAVVVPKEPIADVAGMKYEFIF
jgi:hypothetical protein